MPAFCQPAAGGLLGKHTAGPHLRSQSSKWSVAALLQVPLVFRGYDHEQLQLPAQVQFVDPGFLAKCVARKKLLPPVDHPLQVGPELFHSRSPLHARPLM